MPDTEQFVYLDNAATTFPKPAEMHDAMSRFYRECGVNPGRTGCDLALRAGEMIDQTRRRLSALFCPGPQPKDHNRLVFAPNATGALNLLLQGVVRPGDHVITTALEHNSVIRPINHLVQRGATATFVKPDVAGDVDPQEIRRALRPVTKLVIVNHASNVTGVVQDLESIGAVCEEAGVLFAVDAAQTAGVLPIDMRAAHLDFVAFTGHKGLFGPTGTGGLCVADDVEIESSIWGGTGVRSAEPMHLREFPYRLEAGTQNLMGIAGLSAGLDWIEARGMAAIHRHEMELLGLLEEGLAGIKGVTLYGPRRLARRVAVLSVTVANYDPSDVGTILDVEYGIQTRTGLQCAPLIHAHQGTGERGTVRFSIGPFNTREHVLHAVKAMEEIAADRP